MPKIRTQAAQREFLVLLTVVIGSSMVFLDGTVVNLALPALQLAFRAEFQVVQWFVESYALVLASLLLVGGSLGDRFGHRRVYMCGTSIFALASLAAGRATDSNWLIIARALQGAGGALLVPGSLALLTSAVAPERLGRSIGSWSALSAVTTAIGPVLGGWLIERLSWRWIFFLNLPLALAVILLCLRIPEKRLSEPDGKLDGWGAGFVTAGLACVTCVLIEWPASHHHIWLGVLGSLGVISLAVFGAVEHWTRSPMLPLVLFRSRIFAGANLLTFFIYGPLSAILVFTPLDLIRIQGYTTTRAGAAFLPFVITMLVLSRWAGRLVEKYGPRWPLTAGSLLTGVSYSLFACSSQDGRYWTSCFPCVMFLSLGMALLVAPLSTAVMGSVPQERAGLASGVNNAISRIAGLVAVAICGSLLTLIFTHNLEHQLDVLRLPAAEVESIRSNELKLAAIETSNPLVVAAIRNSFIKAYRVAAWCMFASALSGAAIGWFLKDEKGAGD